LAIRSGRLQLALAGGAEAVVTPLAIAGFGNMEALSKRNDEPARASRPFDKARDGFVLAEGAAVLVLEALDYAKARGATILAEVAGYGLSDDAYHITSPDPEGRGMAACMARAIQD
jgi:3-oxoacyl-[acyl-carrier-protein] synthase II